MSKQTFPSLSKSKKAGLAIFKGALVTASIGITFGMISPVQAQSSEEDSFQPFEINTTRPDLQYKDQSFQPSSLQSIQSSSSSESFNPVNIVINFLGGLTSSQQAVFQTAASTLESILVGYQANISIAQVTINAQGIAIDGAGGILGQAGPTFGSVQGGYTLTTDGIMEFDIADLAFLESTGGFADVILHEMAHVMGFGTLWNTDSFGGSFAGTQSVYIDGTGQYTGAHALAAWQTEYNQPGATFVPVELGGGPGTSDGHWNELDGGALSTGLTDPLGRDLTFELMTGWYNGNAHFSNLTAQSFRDIGYVVQNPNNYNAIPTPALLPGLIGMGVAALRKRKQEV